MPRTPRLPPVAHVVRGDWPEAVLDGDVPAEVVQVFVRRLIRAMGSRSARELAAESGVHQGAISRIIRGEGWPDGRTIALLEQALGRNLWPGRGRG